MPVFWVRSGLPLAFVSGKKEERKKEERKKEEEKEEERKKKESLCVGESDVDLSSSSLKQYGSQL